MGAPGELKTVLITGGTDGLGRADDRGEFYARLKAAATLRSGHGMPCPYERGRARQRGRVPVWRNSSRSLA